MPTRLLLYGERAVLGAKSAHKRVFPKGRHRGPTALKEVFLACPKATAALFLEAFERSFAPHVIVVAFPLRRRRGTCPKTYEFDLTASREGNLSFRYIYLIFRGFRRRSDSGDCVMGVGFNILAAQPTAIPQCQPRL